MTKECTFSNKSLRYGDVAKTWIKYDKRIRTWFSMWGHPLNEEGLGDAFDKMIVQTNWAVVLQFLSTNKMKMLIIS